MNLFAEIVEATRESAVALASRITNVRYDAIVRATDTFDGILFELDGRQWQGVLDGRNSDLILTGTLKDRGVAVRTILDGRAWDISQPKEVRA